MSSTASDPLSGAERLTQLLIAAATTRVWIANAYFVPSEGLIGLLVAKDGAQRRDGAPEVLAAQRATYAKLLAGGVRNWEYQPALLHSKTMLVDAHLSVVGSINLDALSLVAMEEGALVKTWGKDLAYCLEVVSPRPRARLSSAP